MGVVGTWPAVLSRVLGAGPEGGGSVAGVRPSSEGVAGEGPRTGKVVAAGGAVGRRGVVSGEPAGGVAAPALRTLLRGGPLRGACAVGAAAFGKGWLAWSRSPGVGDTTTCPSAPPPPVTFPAEAAEAAAAAAQHNRARPPRLGRLLMARSAPPFIHSCGRSVSHLLLPAVRPRKPSPPLPPPGAPSPPPSDRRPALRAGLRAEGETRRSAHCPPSPIDSRHPPIGSRVHPRDPPAPRPLCNGADQSEDAEGSRRDVGRRELRWSRPGSRLPRLCLSTERDAGLGLPAPPRRQRTRPARADTRPSHLFHWAPNWTRGGESPGGSISALLNNGDAERYPDSGGDRAAPRRWVREVAAVYRWVLYTHFVA